jgi:hypothetical protein
MIVMTASERVVLQTAHDILQDKVATGGGLIEAVRDGLSLVIKASALQPDSPESPAPEVPPLDLRDTWVGGTPPAPQQLPGVPFKPQHPGRVGGSDGQYQQ